MKQSANTGINDSSLYSLQWWLCEKQLNLTHIGLFVIPFQLYVSLLLDVDSSLGRINNSSKGYSRTPRLLRISMETVYMLFYFWLAISSRTSDDCSDCRTSARWRDAMVVQSKLWESNMLVWTQTRFVDLLRGSRWIHSPSQYNTVHWLGTIDCFHDAWDS